MNLDFHPDAILSEPKRVVRWVALGGDERAPSVHVPAEKVIETQTSLDANTLSLRDPQYFVAGQLHQCINEWNYILDQNSNEHSEVIRSWIQHGLDIHCFFRHFHGKTYNSDIPPRQFFPNMSTILFFHYA